MKANLKMSPAQNYVNFVIDQKGKTDKSRYQKMFSEYVI